MSSPCVTIGDKPVGPGHPAFIIAEIGINHNGEVELAKRLVDAAVLAGCDAVKFQKRTPELCVPPEQRDIQRETPWGVMTYFEYKQRMEFGRAEFDEIDAYCKERGMLWFVSCWDEPSVDFMEAYEPPVYKIASASLTDVPLLAHHVATGRPIMVSTGMSTSEEIDAAIASLPLDRLLIAHSTSAYPCPHEELNLRCIHRLQEQFDCPIGYSGHEVGLQTTVAAAAIGACFVERHITLDRTLWGSDQAASVEPHGFARLVRDIRAVETALGDGVKQVYESEMKARERLRRA